MRLERDSLHKMHFTIKSAMEMFNCSGRRTDERLIELVEHYCRLYAIEPKPYVVDAVAYYHSDEYAYYHGDE